MKWEELSGGEEIEVWSVENTDLSSSLEALLQKMGSN